MVSDLLYLLGCYMVNMILQGWHGLFAPYVKSSLKYASSSAASIWLAYNRTLRRAVRFTLWKPGSAIWVVRPPIQNGVLLVKFDIFWIVSISSQFHSCIDPCASTHGMELAADSLWDAPCS
jgi:hypothetical protein